MVVNPPLREVRVLYDGTLSHPRLDHPEGVAVHPRDGTIWCGGEAGQIYRLDPDAGRLEQIADTGGFCLGLAFDQADRLLVCDLARRELVRLAPDTGQVTTVTAGPPGLPLRAPNACAVDAAGTIYLSDSRAQGDPGPGLFRVSPDGATDLWCDATLDFANGVALTADGAGLLVAESWGRRVVRIPIEADGSAGQIEEIAVLPGTVPDGLAVATDGAVWVACYEPSQILRIDPSGEVSVVAADPDAHLLCHPTNIAFRGEQLIAANLGRWHLSVIDVGIGGVALPPDNG